MRKFTDKELELAPLVAEVIGGVWDEPYKHEWPLEHDCLEFLREWGYRLANCTEDDFWHFRVVAVKREHPGFFKSGIGDTLLEALCRVIIECGQKQGKGE